MGRFVEGTDRSQLTLLPECLEDWVGEDNAVHVIDAFVEALDLHEMGFERVIANETGRPSYHPAVLLKLYVYGYLNRVQSSRRLEREACRNVEVMWLIGRLAPDNKTIADFRKDNGAAIRKVCAKFVALCRQMGLLQTPSVAIDGSKFKAVNNRDRNFTHAKMARRMAQIEESVGRYLRQLDSADRQEPSEAIIIKTTRIKEKIARLKQEMGRLEVLDAQMRNEPDQQLSAAPSSQVPKPRSGAPQARDLTAAVRAKRSWPLP
jgi:transposase